MEMDGNFFQILELGGTTIKERRVYGLKIPIVFRSKNTWISKEAKSWWSLSLPLFLNYSWISMTLSFNILIDYIFAKKCPTDNKHLIKKCISHDNNELSVNIGG